jgi:hypothetical protein
MQPTMEVKTMPRMMSASEWSKAFYQLTETRLKPESQRDRFFLIKACAALDKLEVLPQLPEPEWSRVGLDHAFDKMFEAANFVFEDNEAAIRGNQPDPVEGKIIPNAHQRHVKRTCQSLHAVWPSGMRA